MEFREGAFDFQTSQQNRLFYHKMNEREKICIFMKIIIKLD
ncbi:hypothetical protein Nizo2257_0100 [Lactiplantibacillus plantarum]|nr:hypothetical protein Nizo2258_2348 [Lactiplantibacillus plantarum]KZU01541.1 hypothetical protein Nizo2257_0100 [Lactiplantibacillus plantarum]